MPLLGYSKPVYGCGIRNGQNIHSHDVKTHLKLVKISAANGKNLVQRMQLAWLTKRKWPNRNVPIWPCLSRLRVVGFVTPPPRARQELQVPPP